MKNQSNILIAAFLAMWLILGLNACSDDNSTGASEENCSSISLPSQLAQAQISVEYFNSQSVSDDEEHSNYHLVKQRALTGSSILQAGFSTASGYLSIAQGFAGQPESNDGACVWTFDASSFTGGEELTVEVIANIVSDGLQWEVIINGNFEDQDVSDFTFINGFVSSDGSNGEWNLFTPENPGTSSVTYQWDIDSEDDYELTYTTAESVGGESIRFVKEGAENDMTFDDGEGGVTDLYWNTENDSGWIEPDGGERLCYTDFVNSACS